MFLQSAVLCILFTLALIAGGGASASNASDVQADYYNNEDALVTCEDIKDRLPDDDPLVEQCDYFAQLRNSQAAGAVSANSYA